MKNRVAQVVVGLPVEGPFDYLIPSSRQDKLAVGSRVFVPFGKRKLVGFVVGLKPKSSYPRLKTIFSVIDNIPVISSNILKLAKVISQDYGCSWGEAIEITLPMLLRKGRKIDFLLSENSESIPIETPEHILAHDPTCQKRWPLIIENIKKSLGRDQGVIVLVPEIVLIASILERLKSEIAEDIVVLDKKLTAKKELEEWGKIKEGKARLVVGARSAVFAPVKNLGLIVILEEDHPAFKQEQSPYYHTRDVSFFRSTIDRCRVLCISTVPSAEIWHLASKKKMQLISFEAQQGASVQLVDMSDYQWKKSSMLSFPLRDSMQKTLETGGKAILFLNRKGFSTRTRCSQCGYTLQCKRCDSNLVYLYHQKKMVCRHCPYTMLPPTLCPQCRGSYLRYTGMGTEKLESEVARLFPQARVARYDREIHTAPENFQILIATQAVLHLQEKLRVDLIGILQVDSELNRYDFRSAQRTLSLLTQLKNLSRGKLIIQTILPENYCLKAAVKGNFRKFYREEIKFRRQTGFPPFQNLLAVFLRAVKEDVAYNGAQEFYQQIQANNKGKAVEISEPQSDVVPKLRDKYRFTIMLKGQSKKAMLSLIRKALKSFKKKSGMIIGINVDP